MLTGLPRLLGRGFLFGFVLPATIFLLALKAIDHGFHTNLLAIQQDTAVLGIVVIPFTIIFFAILLMAINRPIIRVLEGYGKLNPLKLLQTRQLDQFNKHVEPILDEKKRLDDARKANSAAQSLIPDFSKHLYVAVTCYPDDVQFVLPTKFGNIMRAAEVYPRVIYEIESIQMWNRLQLLLPNRVKDQVKDSRSMLDLVVNLLFLASLILIVYSVLALFYGSLPIFIVPVVAVLTIVLSWIYLPATAVQWGETIKSTFDLYRGLLARNLGLALPKEPSEEVAMWDQVSRMMQYRSREAFLAVAKYRRTPKGERPGRKVKKDKEEPGRAR